MSVRLDVSLEELRRRRGAKWTTFDEQIVPAWVADMDFPIATPPEILHEILGRMSVAVEKALRGVPDGRES